MRQSLHTARMGLAAAVLSLVAVEFSGLPLPYPSSPTVGPVPVDPELLAPALFALVVVVGAFRDGPGVGSIVTGILGVLTLWVATTSLYQAYGTTTGVAWGAFFTLVSGAVLAVAVLVRQTVRRAGRPAVVDRVRTRVGE